MLARLEAHVAEQQRFAANASHELRTPLATTQTLLDVARNDPNIDTGELVDRLHAVNTRAIDLTEALLLLSRTDQRAFPREHVDLSLIAEETTETLLPLAERRGLTIETSGEITPTIGSHPLLLQLSTNLVHNAIVHNLPEQGTVWVTTSVQPKSAVLTVENTRTKRQPGRSVWQREWGHHDRAVAACCVQALGRAAVDEVRHDRVDAAADAELVPDVREDQRCGCRGSAASGRRGS